MLSRSYLGLTRLFLCREKGPRSWSNEDGLSTGQPGGTTGSCISLCGWKPQVYSLLYSIPFTYEGSGHDRYYCNCSTEPLKNQIHWSLGSWSLDGNHYFVKIR